MTLRVVYDASERAKIVKMLVLVLENLLRRLSIRIGKLPASLGKDGTRELTTMLHLAMRGRQLKSSLVIYQGAALRY